MERIVALAGSLLALALGGCTLYDGGDTAAPSPLAQCQALAFSRCSAILACDGDCPAPDACDRNQTVVPMATLTTAQRALSAYSCDENGPAWADPQGAILLDAMLSWPVE
jgi:hypothetical protein